MQRSAGHRGEPRPRPLPCHDASRSATRTGLAARPGLPGAGARRPFRWAWACCIRRTGSDPTRVLD